VVGYSAVATGDTVAFLWQNGRMNNLGTLGDWQSRAVAINNRGQVVGRAWNIRSDRTYCSRAFQWSEGTMRPLFEDLPAEGPCPFNGATPTGIDDVGGIVGNLHQGSHGAFFYRDGTYTPLVPEGLSAHVDAMNNQGLAVGNFRSVGYPQAAVFDLRREGRGELGDQGRFSFAIDINDAGDVILRGGHSADRALLWRNGQHIDLTSQIGPSTQIHAINNAGTVLGTYSFQEEPRFFVWRDGSFSRIVPDNAEWVLDSVDNINDAGEIVGHARNSVSGQTGAVLLRPVLAR
jgi:probable HAF family extracellular repeat protein